MSIADPTYPWSWCPVRHCEFRVCLWADTGLCYQHSLEKMGQEALAQQFAQTHEEEAE